MLHLFKMDVPVKTRAKIVALAEHAGFSQRKIAEVCKVKKSTVGDIIKKYQESGSFSPKRIGNCGRKRKTSVRQDRLLLIKSKADPKKTSERLRQDIAVDGISVSSRTIRRRLCDVGRRARRPVKKQLLTKRMKTKRLEWARNHRNMTAEDWSMASDPLL